MKYDLKIKMINQQNILKTTGVFYEQHSELIPLFGIYFFSIGLFAFIFQVHKYVLENRIIDFARYWEAKDLNERLYRMSGLVANVHHFISIPCIFYFFMFPNPQACEDTSRWSYFNN